MRLIVNNPTGRRVARGGLVFAPREQREALVGSVAYREIKACRALRILAATTDDNKPLTAPPAPDSTPDPEPEPHDNARNTRVPPPAVESAPEPAAAPEAPTRDRGQPAAEFVSTCDAGGLPGDEAGHPCPHCDFVAKSCFGLQSHLRAHARREHRGR